MSTKIPNYYTGNLLGKYWSPTYDDLPLGEPSWDKVLPAFQTCDESTKLDDYDDTLKK